MNALQIKAMRQQNDRLNPSYLDEKPDLSKFYKIHARYGLPMEPWKVFCLGGVIGIVFFICFVSLVERFWGW